jgi:hypothetical protein
MRNYFSTYQLWSAELRGGAGRGVRAGFHGQGSGVQHRAVVVCDERGVQSMAFFESAINEILHDIVDEYDSYPALDEAVNKRELSTRETGEVRK